MSNMFRDLWISWKKRRDATLAEARKNEFVNGRVSAETIAFNPAPVTRKQVQAVVDLAYERHKREDALAAQALAAQTAAWLEQDRQRRADEAQPFYGYGSLDHTPGWVNTIPVQRT